MEVGNTHHPIEKEDTSYLGRYHFQVVEADYFLREAVEAATYRVEEHYSSRVASLEEPLEADQNEIEKNLYCKAILILTNGSSTEKEQIVGNFSRTYHFHWTWEVAEADFLEPALRCCCYCCLNLEQRKPMAKKT